MKQPKISIIIPAHNEEKIIEKSIKSVLNQSYQDFEIIVSNDGSTDRTKEIVEKFMKKDKRIKILNRNKGHSAAFARNRGAEKAKGKIFVFLDADSLINSIFLEEIVKKHEKADGFITLNYLLKGNFMSKVLSCFLGKPFKEKLKDGSIYDKKNKDDAGEMFFCLTKKAYNKIKGYNEKVFYYEDDLFVKDFYNFGFKSIFVKKANQYFELPSSFNEFVRQCMWLGKGTNTIINKKVRFKHKLVWFVKSFFLISPLFFLFNINYFFIALTFTALITYFGILSRCRNLIWALIALPFMYLKTFLVSFNIIRFWK